VRWVSAATLWAAARSAPGYERKSAAFEKSARLLLENAALFCKSPGLLQRRLRAAVPSADRG